jgi:multidrug resistance efflux pump
MEKIPTPMKLQLRRFRYQVLPVLVFVVALVATICLWRNRGEAPNGVGEVTAVSLRVSAPFDGKLADADSPVRLYDHVTVDQVLGRFELDKADVDRHASLQEELEKRQEQLSQTQKDADAARAAGDKAKEASLREQIGPMRKTVGEVREEFQKLSRRVSDPVIRAPVSGTVTAVHHQPGEYVKQGQEVVTITQDDGGYIVGFVRQGSTVMPAQNDPVTIRGQDSNKSVASIVQQVGKQVQPIPEHQLTNAKKPEWGFPVRIAMPNTSEFKLRPGELVGLSYQKRQQ